MLYLSLQHRYLLISIWRQSVCCRGDRFQNGIFSLVYLKWHSNLQSTGEVFWHHHIPINVNTATLHNPLPPGAFGLNVSIFLGSFRWGGLCVYFPPTWAPIVLSKLLAELLTGQFIILIIIVPCWMEAPWLPSPLNMLADAPCQCHTVKHLIRDVSVDQVLRSLSSVHLSLCPLRQVCLLKRMYQMMSFVPLHYMFFLFHLIRFKHDWYNIHIYCSAMLDFWNITIFTRLQNILSHFMHHFLQHPPTCKHFDP